MQGHSDMGVRWMLGGVGERGGRGGGGGAVVHKR